MHAANGCYWNYKKYFVASTSHEVIVDNEFWCSMKNKFQKYYWRYLEILLYYKNEEAGILESENHELLTLHHHAQ